MATMDQQLLNLRDEYVGQLETAEHQVKELQGRIAEWQGKIAAINTLTGGAAALDTETESEADIPEPEDETADDGVFTPVLAYWRPILEVLIDMGGRGRRRNVVNATGERMKGILTPADHGNLPKSGWVRWRNRVAWQASNMRAQGLIRNDSPRGIWEIADAGRMWLGKGKS